jgi:hypothetical protein
LVGRVGGLQGIWREAALVGIPATLGGLGYLLGARLLRMEELTMVAGIVRSRLARSAPRG